MSSAQSQLSLEEIDRSLPHRQASRNSASSTGNPPAFPAGLHLGEQFTVAPRPTLLQVNTVVVNFPDMISVLAKRGN
jgi:hypothetical protein